MASLTQTGLYDNAISLITYGVRNEREIVWILFSNYFTITIEFLCLIQYFVYGIVWYWLKVYWSLTFFSLAFVSYYCYYTMLRYLITCFIGCYSPTPLCHPLVFIWLLFYPAYVPNTCLWDAGHQHFDICCLWLMSYFAYGVLMPA